ncbi:hypothetical protein EME01_57010 [Sinorhizobium meliloti]|nr:hypothetical protein EME01_57010 [Sinorhizobium meliloti]
MHDVLPQILDGTWRTSAQAKAAERERIAEDEPKARKQALKEQIRGKFREAEELEDWKTALATIKKGVALYPNNLSFRQAHVMLHAAFFELFDPAYDHSKFPSVERFAMGKELSEHILALSRLKDDYSKAWFYRMVAAYYHASGNKDRAVELLELAVKSLDGPKPISEVLKDGFLADLLQTLANYKGEKVCYGNVCVAPEEIAPDGVTPKAGKKNPADRGALE